MSLEDPGRRRRIWTTIAISMVIAIAVGFCGFLGELVVPMIRPPRQFNDFIFMAVRAGLNAAAICFWIVFPVLYLFRVPKSAAALDWERRLRVAEEVFKREKAQGRGSWWM